jgi:predicted nuclease with TOPRIM domain
MVNMGRENAAAIAAKDQQLATSHELNSKLREDYEILEERFKKHSKMNDELVNELKEDQKEINERNKKLQDFKDRYDSILQEERSES